MEGPLGMTECSVHTGQCGIEDSCGVRANWRRINDVVADALRAVTLAEMLAPVPPPASRKRIAVQRATTTDRYATEVREREQFYQQQGIHSVPAIIINDRHLISGGQPVEVFEQALRQIAAQG